MPGRQARRTERYRADGPAIWQWPALGVRVLRVQARSPVEDAAPDREALSSTAPAGHAAGAPGSVGESARCRGGGEGGHDRLKPSVLRDQGSVRRAGASDSQLPLTVLAGAPHATTRFGSQAGAENPRESAVGVPLGGWYQAPPLLYPAAMRGRAVRPLARRVALAYPPLAFSADRPDPRERDGRL